MQKPFKRSLAAALAGLAAAAAAHQTLAGSNEQFFPLATYRVGAYASSGIPVWAGMIDYLRYINDVEGGINGVKLVWQECETEWTAEKGIECYERFKKGLNGAPVAIYHPNGAPAAYALSDKAAADKIPLITLGYGRTEATDGGVFPYNFPAMLTFYSEASVVINYIAQREGGFEKLKGKKIATVYHDSAYGRETQGTLELLAKKYGFENIQIPVADPGNEQSAQWRQVRQAKPDWVFLRTWGVSTPVAIKTAARFGFPADRIIGDIWASSNEDVLPAGEAGKGYLALTPYPGGAGFDIHKRIKQHILDKGKSDLKDPKSFGSVYYNSGLINAAIAVEHRRCPPEVYRLRRPHAEAQAVLLRPRRRWRRPRPAMGWGEVEPRHRLDPGRSQAPSPPHRRQVGRLREREGRHAAGLQQGLASRRRGAPRAAPRPPCRPPVRGGRTPIAFSWRTP